MIAIPTLNICLRICPNISKVGIHFPGDVAGELLPDNRADKRNIREDQRIRASGVTPNLGENWLGAADFVMAAAVIASALIAVYLLHFPAVLQVPCRHHGVQRVHPSPALGCIPGGPLIYLIA